MVNSTKNKGGQNSQEPKDTKSKKRKSVEPKQTVKRKLPVEIPEQPTQKVTKTRKVTVSPAKTRVVEGRFLLAKDNTRRSNKCGVAEDHQASVGENCNMNRSHVDDGTNLNTSLAQNKGHPPTPKRSNKRSLQTEKKLNEETAGASHDDTEVVKYTVDASEDEFNEDELFPINSEIVERSKPAASEPETESSGGESSDEEEVNDSQDHEMTPPVINLDVRQPQNEKEAVEFLAANPYLGDLFKKMIQDGIQEETRKQQG